jgi:hypothetical protein
MDPNASPISRDASQVNNDSVEFDPLTGFRRFFGQTTTEDLGSRPPLTMPPPAPLGPRSRAIEIETSAEAPTEEEI